jgi:hypothetical protein
MATVGQNYLTLADLYAQREGGKVTANIIEMLAQINPILQDMITMECNDGSTHLTTVRTGLPAGTWRRLYQGVQPTKSGTAQVRDTTGMLEDWSEVDKKLVDLAVDKAQFRLNEAQAHIEGIANDMATTLFYGNTQTDPEQFMGLAPRFNSLSAPNGSQIVDAGGTGADNTSIWFVVWGENTCHGLFPKGSMAGLQRVDLGPETKTNSDGSVLRVMREQFMWDLGLSVRDWRYISRVANIDVSDLRAGTVQVEDFMVDAYYLLRQRRVTNGNAAIYCNTAVKAALHKLAKDKANVNLVIDNFEGEEIVRFIGMPIREVDAITNAEAQIT